MKNKFLKLFVIINIVFFAVNNFTKAAFADTTYSSSSLGLKNLNAFGPNISIIGNGHVFVTSGLAVSGSAVGKSFGITINTTDHTQGISANNTGSLDSAIKIVNARLKNLDIISGTVTSNVAHTNATGTIFLSKSAPDTVNATSGVLEKNNITLSANGTISNTAAAGGNAINFDATTTTRTTPVIATLNVNNAGTISTISNTNSNAILVKDSLAGAILNVDNSGTINAGIGHAVKVVGHNEASITNSGTIIGDIDLGTNSDSSITLNGGSVTGNLATNDAGQVINMLSGSLTGDIDLTGELNLAGVAGNNITGDIAGSGLANLNLNEQNHTLDGALTLNAGDNLSVGITDSSAAGSIIASGVSSLSSSTSLNIALGSNTTTAGSSYRIVSAATGSTINKISTSNITVDDSSTNYNDHYLFTTKVIGTDLFMDVRSFDRGIYNSRYNGIYLDILNTSAATGSLAAMQNYLDSSASRDQKLAALDSAEAQLDNSVNRITFDNINTYSSIISNRLKTIHNTKNDSNPINKAFWGEAFGSTLNQNNSADISGYKASNSGFTAGFDRKIEKGLVVGIAGVYSSSSIKSSSDTKKINMNTYQINLYSGYSVGQYFINSLIGAGFNQYNSNRNILVAAANANAKYSGQSYVARVEAGKNYDVGNNFTLTPSFTLTAARNSIGAYDETGAGTLNLRVKNRDTDFFETRFGTTLTRDYRFSQNSGVTPLLSLSYGYDLIGGRQRADTKFISNSTSFNSSSSAVEKGSVRVGTGIKFYKVNGFSLRADYNFEHRAGFDSHAGSLSGRMIF